MKHTNSAPEVMSMQTHPDCYGPNYRTAKAERKAVAYNKQHGVVAALFVAFIVLLPLLWAIHTVTPGADGCHTTVTWCSVQGGGQ